MLDVEPERARPRLACRIQHDLDGVRWHQVVERGVVVVWELGDVDDPDVELRWTTEDALAVHRGRRDGTDALRHVVTVEGLDAGAPAPMDLASQPALAELPHLPDATLSVQYEYPDGPFGHVSFFISFVDGRVEGMSLGRRPDADVMVEVPFLVMALVRRGDLTILQALEHGRVEGDIGYLGLLAGISESPEFHRAELACGGSGLALGTLGACLADPGYRSAWAELASQTSSPVR